MSWHYIAQTQLHYSCAEANEGNVEPNYSSINNNQKSRSIKRTYKITPMGFIVWCDKLICSSLMYFIWIGNFNELYWNHKYYLYCMLSTFAIMTIYYYLFGLIIILFEWNWFIHLSRIESIQMLMFIIYNHKNENNFKYGIIIVDIRAYKISWIRFFRMKFNSHNEFVYLNQFTYNKMQSISLHYFTWKCINNLKLYFQLKIWLKLENFIENTNFK